ncbi:MAG: gliding motility-associated C-terminal domain-containing protein [Chitinophagaceae bacterium]
MRKSILLLLILSSFGGTAVFAQNSLFDFETDTLCVGQKLNIVPHAMNASTYYWGFCSGYLDNKPVITDRGNTYGFNTATGIEVGKDASGNFYGFAVNDGTELLRLNFGKTLSNTPTVDNFGTLDSTISNSPNSLYLTLDNGKWHLFIVGGSAGFGGGGVPSTISRVDFGTSLGNVPNGVNMGNIGGALNDPRGIWVAKDGTDYYGFAVNAQNNQVVRLNFGKNISNTPTTEVINPIGSTALNGPTDMAPIYDNGFWYCFIPSYSGNVTARLYFGNTLSNVPAISTVSIGGMGTKLKNPGAITITKDCGGFYAYILNRGNDSLLRYNVPDLTSNWNFNTAYIGALDQGSDITRVIRDHDSLFILAVNRGNNALVSYMFPQCQNASIQSSDKAQPPAPKYNVPGIYNVYLAINEGLPNMQIDCKQVEVVKVPPINLSADTLICQGDTLSINARSQFAVDYFFSPNYNLSDTEGINIKAYPRVPTTYTIRIPFANGCEVDTTLMVDVSRVKADAGPDRTIADGSSTVLGGPNTYTGKPYTYRWFPTDFMDNPFSLNPTVTPIKDITYYLQITNTDKCTDIDTVNVKTICNGFNLPNAFAPDNDRGVTKRFGIMNTDKLSILNYFRIYDRWGKEVFSTTDATSQWDGNVNGNPAPFGVYVWVADGFCASGERINKTGNVTLIR